MRVRVNRSLLALLVLAYTYAATPPVEVTPPKPPPPTMLSEETHLKDLVSWNRYLVSGGSDAVRVALTRDKLCTRPQTRQRMGIADRIYDLVRALPEAEASKILRFAEELRFHSASVVPAKRQVDLALFRHYRGRYDGMKIDRDALYDRACLR